MSGILILCIVVIVFVVVAIGAYVFYTMDRGLVPPPSGGSVISYNSNGVTFVLRTVASSSTSTDFSSVSLVPATTGVTYSTPWYPTKYLTGGNVVINSTGVGNLPIPPGYSLVYSTSTNLSGASPTSTTLSAAPTTGTVYTLP